MPGKNRIVRQISLPAPVTVGSVITAQATNYGSPARPLPPAPEGLALATTTERNAATPTARIAATWVKPTGVQPERYTVQWSEDSTFPDDESNGQSEAGPSGTIPSLATATRYYVHVAAWVNNVRGEWSETVSITTASDTLEASQPTSLAGSWIGAGDLQLTWVNPPEENFKEAEIKIYASSGGTLLRTVSSAAGRFLYTAAMNLADTSGVGDPSLFIEARSRTFSNITNNTSVPTLTTTKPVPTTPTVTHSWSSETAGNGVSGPDLTLNWTAIADARTYRLTLDGGTAREISATRYTYPLDTNRADHTGTPDPAITYSLVAVDGLGQSSTAASGTATNQNPPTTAVTLAAGFSAVAISATPSAAADLRDYTFRIIKDGSTLATYRSSSPDQVYQATARGSYQVGVIVNDVFGQASTETVSSAVTLDALTVTELRSEAIYTDSIGTDFTSGANSTVLKDDAVGAGITYAISASAYRWTQLERPFRERYRRVSIKCGSGGANFYLATSQDGTTWRWFAGVGGDGYTMVERADEATAQANVSLTTSLVNGWVELPVTVEARYVRLYHRHTSASYRLDEFYGYTLVIADMIRAGDIATIHLAAGSITTDKITALAITAAKIAAGTITADKLNVATLSAITANVGTLTSGTINGVTVVAGSGTVTLDSNGVGITGDSFAFNLTNLSPVTIARVNAVEWTVTSGQKASISGSTAGQLLLRGQKITLAIPIGGSNTANYGLTFGSTGAHAITATTITVSEADATAPPALTVVAGLFSSSNYVKIRGALNVGNTTVAGDNEIVTVGAIYPGTGSAAQHSYYFYNTGSVLATNTHFMAGGALFPSGQSSYSFQQGSVVGYTALYASTHLAIAGFAISTAGGLMIKRDLTDSSSRRNWAFHNEQFTVGDFCLFVSTTNTGAPSAMVAQWLSNGCMSFNANAVGSASTSDAVRIYGTGTGSSSFGLVIKNSSGGNNFYVRDDGAGFLNAAAWSYSSDLRLKERVRSLQDDLAGSSALSVLDQLRPIAFDYISGACNQYGFAAQEVQKILPHLVHVTGAGRLGLQTTSLIPFLVGAIQELAARVRQLERTA